LKIIIDGNPDNDALVERKAKLNKKIIEVQLMESEKDEQLFDDYYVYALYCFEKNKLQKAYKRVSGSTILLIMYLNSEECYEMRLETYESPDAQERGLLVFFNGGEEIEIFDTVDDLQKRYDPSNNLPKYIFGALFLVMVIGGGYLTVIKVGGADSSEVNTSIEQVQTPPLTPEEVNRLKRGLSLDLLDKLKEEALKIATDPRLKTRSAITTTTFNYEQKPGIMTMRGSIGREYTFPAVGTALGGENIYTKIEPFEIQKTKADMGGVTYAGLSVECVKQALEIPSKEASVQERTEDKIKIKYIGVSPKVLFKDFRQILTYCPVAMESISLQEGDFDLTATIYTTEEGR